MRQRIVSGFAATFAVAGVVGMVGAVPAAYAVNTTTVNANIGSTITVATTGSPVNLAITPTPTGSATSASDSVTVTTNNSAGYTLKLASSTAALTNGGNTLGATSGTIASPAALGNNTWGFRIDDSTATTGFGSGPTSAQTNVAAPTSALWAAVPTTATTFKVTNTAATSGDATTVWYAAKADTTKPSGTYTATVTYTATTN